MTRPGSARHRCSLLVGVLASLLLAACASPPGDVDPAGGMVRIAAAADLKFALEEVGAELAETRPDITLATTYGSSGTFLQQLSNGAPFDLFLSADMSYPEQLVEAGLAGAADLFPYAVGRLVVWAPVGSPVDPSRGVAALADPAARKVAIANPEHAPYGRAAVAAMQTAGVYDAVADRLVLGENVAQAAEFVVSGNAQVGIVALSLALAPSMADRGAFSEVPLDTYPTIEQGGVVMASAQAPAAARAVRDYLTGDEGTRVLRRYGFYLPDDPGR